MSQNDRDRPTLPEVGSVGDAERTFNVSTSRPRHTTTSCRACQSPLNCRIHQDCKQSVGSGQGAATRHYGSTARSRGAFGCSTRVLRPNC